MYSVTISAGIGYIFLGNVYDNVERPRQVTVLLLIILSIISLVEAIFSSNFNTGTSKLSDDNQTTVAMTLY